MDSNFYPDVPPELHPALEKALDRLQQHEIWPGVIRRDARVAATLHRVIACSEYVADVLARYPETLTELLIDGRMHRPLDSGELELVFLSGSDEQESEEQFMHRLRRFRHRELMRIVWRNLVGWSVTTEMLAELSAVADTCIRAAFLRSTIEMESRYGKPLTDTGAESHFIIVAMGKLGGGELNFSSDVDLVFLYSAPGETNGARPQSNEEFFQRLARHLINLLSKKTSDGFVYRVDARLRPFGDSGPLACSVDAFEDYLLQHGRDWERYAWVKARIINVWAGAREFYTSVLRPFVFRRYLDFGVFTALREWKNRFR